MSDLEAGCEAHLGATLVLDQLIEDPTWVVAEVRVRAHAAGIFEEDEMILVAIGGVLGAAVGAVQAALVLVLALETRASPASVTT